MIRFWILALLSGSLVIRHGVVSGAESANPASWSHETGGRVEAAGSGLAPPAATPLGQALEPRGSAILPPLSSETIDWLKHDHATAPGRAKGRLQIGVGRPLVQPIVINENTAPADKWTVLTNGWRIWQVAVVSQGAVGLRVHLQSVSLPDGAQVVMYDATNLAQSAVVCSSKDLSDIGDVWAQAVYSEQVVVECQVPPGVDLSSVAFTIAEVSHLYQLPMANSLLKDAAESCENDATCYTAWTNQEAGVALIQFVDSGQTYLCTGCLLADSNPSTSSEYFLTANHCITDQTIAATIEFYWFYQTKSCNGRAPSQGSVPRTGPGADLLTNSAASDFSFIRLRQKPPAGAFYLGWSTATPVSGETLTVVHHPNGDFTRISFGNLTGSDPDFWQVQWFSGVTEPGSSGSPLFNAKHEVIGQLYGGTSDCTNPSGNDTFGRFDETYKAIKRWIDNGALLTIITNGVGSVSPNYGGKLLQIGQTYHITAIPGSGNLFNGWSRSIVTNTPGLTFVMHSNLVLQANFVTNPFIPFKGAYTGLFREPGGAAPQSAGYFTLAATDQGKFSGTLQIGVTRYSLSGQFDLKGTAQTVARYGKATLGLQFSLGMSKGVAQLTGTISNGVWTANLAAYRSVFDGRTNIPPQAGRYTMIIPGTNDPAIGSGGDSYATVVVGNSGKISFSAVLADNTRVSQTTVLSPTGEWPLFVPAYSGKGLLFSWMKFSQTLPGLDGSLTWIKTNLSKANYYAAGFTNQSAAWGSPYIPPAAGTNILSFTNANLVLSGDDLAQNITVPVTLTAKNRATGPATNRLSFAISPSTGLFNGQVKNPNTRKMISFQGVVLQSAGIARGFFLNTDQSGSVLLEQ